MPMKTRHALLTDRGVVSVSGPDAARLLQGIITNDMDRLEPERAMFAGLLSPQGKVQFNFLVVKRGTGFLLDVARDRAGEFAKRLMLYRLRAKVDIVDASEAYTVTAAWGTTAGAIIDTGVSDPRLPALGLRIITPRDKAMDAVATTGAIATAADYHAHRIALGVPEGGKDYAFGDAFPHEACMDQLNGISFTKGCYVGQEIVARMEHRGTARKRIVPVVAATALPATGTDIVAGDVTIGTLGSTADTRGLALIRLDRAAEFNEKGVGLTAGGVPLSIQKPVWATFDLDPRKPGEAAGHAP
ncbi:MAG: CAF17-like 4Fe-4S cluster assembly/insertion protein YgfZ [Hyphomicrobium sp.]